MTIAVKKRKTRRRRKEAYRGCIGRPLFFHLLAQKCGGYLYQQHHGFVGHAARQRHAADEVSVAQNGHQGCGACVHALAQGQGAGGVRRREQTALLYRAGINGSERSFNGVPRCSGRSHHAVPVRNGDGRARRFVEHLRIACGKGRKFPDGAVFLEDHLARAGDEDLQRVAHADELGSAYFLGDDHTPKVV